MLPALLIDLRSCITLAWISTITALSGLFSKVCGLLQVAERFDVARRFLTSPEYRSRRLYTAKTFGVLITLAFASGSLYYAKRAADYAKCQLDLAKIESCRAHPDFLSEDDCKRLFKHVQRRVFSDCFSPRPHHYYVYTIRGIRRYTIDICGAGYATPTWWDHWHYPYGGSLLNFWSSRPILWRFPDVYDAAEYGRSLGSTVSVLDAAIMADMI